MVDSRSLGIGSVVSMSNAMVSLLTMGSSERRSFSTACAIA
jgi:hypothetical protein